MSERETFEKWYRAQYPNAGPNALIRTENSYMRNPYAVQGWSAWKAGKESAAQVPVSASTGEDAPQGPHQRPTSDAADQWVSVPREPTEAMRKGGYNESWFLGRDVVSIYRAMLASAPTPAPGDGWISVKASEYAQLQDKAMEMEVLLEEINTPEVRNFLLGVERETAHQVQRWGTVGDRAKAPQDWYWLLGYLSGKALAAHIAGDLDKARHHTISSAAALAQWHAHLNANPSISPVSSDVPR